MSEYDKSYVDIYELRDLAHRLAVALRISESFYGRRAQMTAEQSKIVNDALVLANDYEGDVMSEPGPNDICPKCNYPLVGHPGSGCSNPELHRDPRADLFADSARPEEMSENAGLREERDQLKQELVWLQTHYDCAVANWEEVIKERDNLRWEVGWLRPHYEGAMANWEEMITARDAKDAEIRKLREALEFYQKEWVMNGEGDPSEPHLYHEWPEPSDKLMEDAGEVARKALANPRPEETT